MSINQWNAMTGISIFANIYQCVKKQNYYKIFYSYDIIGSVQGNRDVFRAGLFSAQIYNTMM